MRTIRTLDFKGVETLLGWAAEEGWNPGLADALAFLAADLGGFIGAFVDDVMVAGISAVAYDDRFGFIGLYICHPDHRGRGHGRAVWDAAMQRLGDRTVGLDGVPEQQSNYRRMGFVTAYETVRMTGTLPPSVWGAYQSVLEVSRVASLDRAAFPADRTDFLRSWITRPNRAFTLGDVSAPTAFAVWRPCRQAAKVGPLIASDTAAAIAMLGAIEGEVQLDVPTQRREFLFELEQMGFQAGFSTARMYRGVTLGLPATLFSPCTLELG